MRIWQIDWRQIMRKGELRADRQKKSTGLLGETTDVLKELLVVKLDGEHEDVETSIQSLKQLQYTFCACTCGCYPSRLPPLWWVPCFDRLTLHLQPVARSSFAGPGKKMLTSTFLRPSWRLLGSDGEMRLGPVRAKTVPRSWPRCWPFLLRCSQLSTR